MNLLRLKLIKTLGRTSRCLHRNNNNNLTKNAVQEEQTSLKQLKGISIYYLRSKKQTLR
jgi:hypothetical protein